MGTQMPYRTHCINARQLHADVDHGDGDDLPADAGVRQQVTNGDGLHGGQGALLLLHLLHLRLDVSFRPVPLQG